MRGNSLFNGVAGQGWFLGLHCLTRYVKIAFFRGADLRPPPPGASKDSLMRYLDVYENDPPDDARLARWVRQAAKLPGWDKN